MKWTIIRIVAHTAGSVAWFIAVEAVDLSRGGHWRIEREGIQLLLSPLLIFPFTFANLIDASRQWPFLAASMPAYAAVAWAVYASLSRRALAEDRWARGCCPACGYCLAGNTSGVCPECGRRWRPETCGNTP